MNAESSKELEAALRDVLVNVSVIVGTAKLPFGDLLEMERDAIIELDQKVADPVSLIAGDRVVAYGELQELDGSEDGQIAVRITEIVHGPAEPE